MEEPGNVVSIRDRKTRLNQSLAEKSDDDLMMLTRGGMEPAFDELIRRHQAVVLRVAVKQTGDSELARDVAQNTFVEIYRYLPRYKAQGRFRALLFRILTNQCRMLHRRGGCEQRAWDVLAASHQRSTSPAGPEEEILARERRREVERALSQLSPKLGAVVGLRYAAGLSYQEIGDALEVPVGTVKSRLFAGLERLRTILVGKGRA